MLQHKGKEKLKVSLPEDHLGYWLRYVSNNVAYALSQKLEDSGVTVAEWIVLRQMYLKNWVSPMSLAIQTGLTQGAISKLIDRLLKKKFVTKKVSKHDHRYKEIKLTSVGRKIVPRLASIADENDDYFFGKLSSAKKKQLMSFFIGVVKINRFRKSLNMRVNADDKIF
ncbi:MAG: MarR family transcriptional regulator [Candidatus Omnitrophica bacterium]|nr:MarR family transcriptional regulator [Candidatus Omnitrophota bacterium]MDE2009859.1 MarR family transcriptional regulator [Candidatus Omnitrophota bacterium]MDE2214359.1 MarR family transcriptional regulator [Candidatus Omnitrophota bacterium]MDE2231108.1 MarR family transcriptional regulator [Candidatus Omnitrophota bacterium]